MQKGILVGAHLLTAAETDVRVPHSSAALGVRMDVPFNDDRARSCTQSDD